MLKLGKKKKKDAAPDDGATDLAVAHGHDAGGEGDAAPKKKKIPLLFIIIPAAVVVLGGGGGAAFFLMQPKPAAAEGEAGHGEEAAAKDDGHGAKKEEKGGGGHGGGGEEADPALGVIKEGPDGVTFYSLPPMTVNLQPTDGRSVVMKLVLTLEMHDHDLATTLQGEFPRMQDMFQTFLREVRPEELQGSAGTYQLKAEILRRVNMVAAPAKVDAVLIEEMLVQ